jgi:hypothetical protein
MNVREMEVLEGGPLDDEEALGKGMPLGEDVEGAHREAGPGPESVDAVEGRDVPVRR